MGFVAGAALSGIVLPTAVRPRDAGVMGVSIFLLVSVRLGDCGVRTAGNRVLQAENLTGKILMGGLAGFSQCCPAAVV